MSTVAVIGEALADAFVQSSDAERGELTLKVLPGGGPANTAVALARLGTPTQFRGRLGRGILGDLLRRHLLGSGVDLSASVAATQQTTLALAAVDGDGVASYDFYANGTADWQWTVGELAAWSRDDVVAIHTGSLALALTPSGPLIEDLLRGSRPTATISVDPNVRPGIVGLGTYRERMSRWAGLADILRLSEDDLSHLYPGTAVERTCDQFHRQGVRLVVVTRGPAGALASLDGERTAVPAMDIVPVDTVGAGDAFTAGLLHWLHQRGHLGGRLASLGPADLARAMAFAALVAGRTCQVGGADPPWARDLPTDAATPAGGD